MDIIILSYTKDLHYYNMLAKCIESIGDFNITVVETNSKLEGKDMMLPAKFIFPKEKFNYNRYLNYGFRSIADIDKVIISNNDVIYDPGCIEKLFNSLDVYDSVSPTEEVIDKNIVGSKVGEHVKGWCIGLTSKVYQSMGEWDERFAFWYQDNDYCSFIREKNFSHALIGSAVAHHEGSKSHGIINDIYSMTHGSIDILKDKWGDK